MNAIHNFHPYFSVDTGTTSDTISTDYATQQHIMTFHDRDFKLYDGHDGPLITSITGRFAGNEYLAETVPDAAGGTCTRTQSDHTRHPFYRSPCSTRDYNSQQPLTLSSQTMYTDLTTLASSEDPVAVQSDTINSFYAEESDFSISCHSLARKEELLQQQIRALRSRIHELERLATIGPETAPSDHENLPLTSTITSSPESHSTSPSAFEEGWRARTAARKKLFCSLNRAGNCLCAWHDSRRERRTYPPRMAPPGYLNCGCTHDEALFEESLARHGVGSYKPGEHVRMDPALRNPLLKLLQERYGYRDGDFERDPVTGDWLCDEEPTIWEPLTVSPGFSRYTRRGVAHEATS